MKVHKHFYHPDSERLYAVMKRANPTKASPQVLRDLRRINETCHLCQRLAHAPHRFHVALPDEDVIFNRTVCLDLMYLDNSAVLHVVDKDTKFSAASFLAKETAEETWKTFMSIWVCVYIGFPDIMATDQGPQFKSSLWENLVNMAGIRQNFSGVQSHNALGVGERYHSFLRQIYRRVRHDHPNLDKTYTLSLSVKAMNDTAGYHGLVPTLLVFGVMPQIPITPVDLPNQMVRMRAMARTRKEMSCVIAKEKISKALRMNVPTAALNDIAIGSQVLVYREKPENRWVGPHRVIGIKGKCIFLDLDGNHHQVSIVG